MEPSFTVHPCEIIPKIKELLEFAEEKEWYEEDLYFVAKVILVHFEQK